MYYPTLQNVELIIKQMNKRYNMDVVITNKGLLEFALEKPNTKLFGIEQYPELYQKAAVLMEILTKIHALSDGNKRTAMMAAEFMIKANGGELVLPLKTIRLSVDTAMDENDLMREQLQQWFKVRTATNVYQLCLMLAEHLEEETIIKKLWNLGQYDQVEKLVGKWMAFDSYPENKQAWDDLVKQWRGKKKLIMNKQISTENEWTQVWSSILTMAKHDHGRYGEILESPVKKIEDLTYYDNSLEELKNAENMLLEREESLQITTDPETIHQNALILQTYGNYEDAIKFYRKLTELEPDNKIHSLYHIAIILTFNLNRYEESLEIWDECLKIDPSSWVVSYGKGITLTKLNQNKDAIIYFDLSLKKNPKDIQTLLAKCNCLVNLGLAKEALQYAQAVIQIDNGNIDGYGMMGIAYNDLNDYENALKSQKKVIELDPSDPIGLYNYALALSNLERDDESIAFYEKVIKISPDHAQAWINLGSILSNSEKREEAIPYFEKGLKLEPNNDVALTSMGITLFYLKRYNDAIYYFDRVLSLDPNDVDALLGKADALSELGDTLESLDLLERAIRLKPDYKKKLTDPEFQSFSKIRDSKRFQNIIK